MKYFSISKGKLYQYIGCIVETIPFTVTGLTLASYNFINEIKEIKEKKKLLFVNIIVLFFIKKYDIIRSTNGVVYPGIDLNIGGICLIICFSFITIKKTIFFRHITNYTGGVYYLHIVVKNIFKKQISFIGNKTLLGGFIIYIISYFICFIGMRIFGNTKLKNLFY